MTRPVVFQSNGSVFTYTARTDPSPLIASPSTVPPTENRGSLQVVITVPPGGPYPVTSIAFNVDVGTTNALMQSADDLILPVPLDPNSDDDWQWALVTLSPSQTQFVLSPSDGNPIPLSDTAIVVEIANFITVQQPCSTTIQITETLSTTQKPTLTVTTFPEGFFFDTLGAWTEDGSTPVAEVANGTKVQLQWNSSADGSQVTIYMSGEDPVTPEDTGAWVSPALTEDTVFTVAAAADGIVLSSTVAVSVASPDITASSVTAGSATVNGALAANSVTTSGATVNGTMTTSSLITSSATVNGALTLIGSLSSTKQLLLPSDFSPGASGTLFAYQNYVSTTDGFVSTFNSGWINGNGANGPAFLGVISPLTALSCVGSESNPAPLLVPVPAGQTFQIAITLQDNPPAEAVPASPYFDFVSFGNGTVSTAPDDSVSSEQRARLRDLIDGKRGNAMSQVTR